MIEGSSTLVQADELGMEWTDLFTGETYIDNTEGPGDGRLDDCIGILEIPEGNQGAGQGEPGAPVTMDTLLARPDGFADAYILNPGWGEMFLIGNFNTSEYDSVVLELRRRQYRNWQMEASYTWSKAIGDSEDFVSRLPCTW